MVREIRRVDRLGGHRLRLHFDDGVVGEVDISSLVEFDGVFDPLSDPSFFARVRVEPDLGTIVWPNGADLDPDVLYAAVIRR